MTAIAPAGLADMKQHTRAAWAAGDFPEVARTQLWEVGTATRPAGRCRYRRGRAGRRLRYRECRYPRRRGRRPGGRSGPDPELFDAGRRQAADAGVQVEWVEGDAEELPFDDDSFDVVLSTFGCMFAPRHRVAAAEMARVLRPGGRLGVCAWTPEGQQGEFFRTLGAYLPPAPDFAEPPLLWGTEQHVRQIFAGTGVDLEFDRDAVVSTFTTGAEAVDFAVRNFGPLIMLRPMLEAAGTWSELLTRMAATYDRREPAEYLVTLGRMS